MVADNDSQVAVPLRRHSFLSHCNLGLLRSSRSAERYEGEVAQVLRKGLVDMVTGVLLS